MSQQPPEEIIEYFVEGERERLTERVTKIVAALERGEKPYHQFTMTWKEAVKWRKKIHGKDKT